MHETGEAFIRWIKVGKLGRDPYKFQLDASEAERNDLAQRLGILGVSRLQATGTLTRLADRNLVELNGTVSATVTQACVVSLEPVTEKIEEEFTVCYTFDKQDTVLEDVEYVVKLDEEDLPELIHDGQIDVALAIGEQIALAMTPYPRAENVSDSEAAAFVQQREEAEAEKEVYRPFANLKDLMNKK